MFHQALIELNKEVESLSGKSIKDFVFTLPFNFNLKFNVKISTKCFIDLPDTESTSLFN